MNNFTFQSQKDLPFFELYESIEDRLEKRKFRKAVIKACRIEPTTFYTWLNRKQIPALPQKAISELLNMDEETLFPVTEKQVA